MNELEDFVSIFRAELIDSSLTSSSIFKNHEHWTSLTSLIIVTEIDSKFGILIDVETLRQSKTIEDLYNEAILVKQK